ncbi:ATP-binding protein [Shewanella sp. VB17]|nr:ATP-binding protein [Shewanella sp. VB17]
MKVFRWQILSISDHALPLIQPLMLAADIFAHLLASQHTLARTPEIIPTLVPQHDAVIAACFDAQLKQPLRQVNMLTGLDADDRSALVAQFASDLERPWHYVAPKLRHNASSCEVIRAFRQMLLRANLQTCYIYWPDLLSDILEQGSSDGLLALLFCANHTPADNQTSAIAPPIILFCDQALNDSDGSALHWLDSTLLDNLWSSVCFAQPIEPLTLHLTQPKLEQISRGWLALSARLLANTVANSPCFIRGLSAANAVYLANLYPLSATTMSRVGVKIAKVLARSQGHVSLFELLQQACLQANSEISGQLASLSQPRYQLSDMILDEHTQEQLQELIDRLVYRAQLTQAMPHFVAGIQALFWGKPGTGKSMAAEAIAGQLKLPLYKVNLANVASKWIGESEKHLAQLFDNAQKQNAVLLFDEADAIFAKRSEVESSHDKNANMGVSFLLQRMESYTGLLLLSTNFKSNLDDAFLRRFHGVVEFMIPDAHLRLQLWQKAWSDSTLLAADIDLQSLAQQFEFTPSQINNIAERALLFTIKAQQKTISKALLGKAVTREFEKQNAGFLSEQKLTRWLALN